MIFALTSSVGMPISMARLNLLTTASSMSRILFVIHIVGSSLVSRDLLIKALPYCLFSSLFVLNISSASSYMSKFDPADNTFCARQYALSLRSSVAYPYSSS